MIHRFTIAGLAVVFCLLSIPVKAQSLDQIGVTLLRAVTTNLNGAGIRVAQPEPGDGNVNYWQVGPASVGQPTNLFTYLSSSGTSSVFTNNLGLESGHANKVARQFYGIAFTNGIYTNIVTGVATNVAHVNNFDADYYVQLGYYMTGPTTNWVCTLSGADAMDQVVNQSFIFGSVPNPISVAMQQAIDTSYDNYAATNQTFFVSGAGNGGGVCPPSTCYNGVSVGAYKNGQFYNSVGPTFDNGRCKPDIAAWGDATSYSTPQVSGAAAVLMQAALRGGDGVDTNAAADLRTIKALLLNGAVKPANWTNSNVFPLDARYGAGLLNVFNSYWQLMGGKHGATASNTVALNADHPPISATGAVSALSGWNFATNTSGKNGQQFDAIHHYFFNVSNTSPLVKFTVTATLAWNRQAGKTSINDLDLCLYNCADSNLVAESVSYVNNVEHLYVTNLAQGRYDLQVWKAGGSGIVSSYEPYAVAWQFAPLPELAAVREGTNTLLTWPVYPAGFRIETRTNLLAGSAWATNGLPAAVITNGQNSIRLNMTNAAQFFRLRQPNF